MTDAAAHTPVTVPAEPPPGDGLPGRMGANAAMNYAADVVMALSALIVTPLILRHLGQAAFGVWALAGMVTVYLELFEFGFGTATVKLVAEDAFRRPREVLVTFNTNFFVLAALGFVGLVAGLVVAVLAPDLFSVPDSLRDETVFVFAILTITLAASVPLDVIGGALAGHQRYDIVSGVNSVAMTILGVASVAVLLLGGGLIALAVVNTTVMLAMHVVRWHYLARLVPGLRISPSLVRRDKIRTSARLSGWFLVREIADVLIHRVDVVVVGAILGIEAAAVYAVGGKLALLGRRAVQPVSKLFFPHASAVGDDRGRIRSLVIDGSRTTLLLGAPVALVLVLLAGPGVEAWVGPGFADAARVLAILAVAEGIFALSETYWYVLAGAGKVRLVGTVTMIEAAVNLAVSLLLARRFGLPGVAFGTLTAAVAIDLPASVWFVTRFAGISLPELGRRVFLPHLVPAVAGGTVAALLALVIPASTIPVLAAGAMAVLVYLALYALVGAQEVERVRVAGFLRTWRRRLARDS